MSSTIKKIASRSKPKPHRSLYLPQFLPYTLYLPHKNFQVVTFSHHLPTKYTDLPKSITHDPYAVPYSSKIQANHVFYLKNYVDHFWLAKTLSLISLGDRPVKTGNPGSSAARHQWSGWWYLDNGRQTVVMQQLHLKTILLRHGNSPGGGQLGIRADQTSQNKKVFISVLTLVSTKYLHYFS